MNTFGKSCIVKNNKAILILALIATSLMSLILGSSQMGLRELMSGLFMREGFDTVSVIIYHVRLPRLCASILSGIGLSLSGVLLQSITDNKLASPGIIGVNSGAGFASIMLLYFLPVFFYILPFAAFAGAFLSTLVILGLSRLAGDRKSTLILAGIAMQSLLGAGISFISMLDSDVLTSYNYFSIGGFSGVLIAELIVPAIIIVVCLLISLLLSGKIELICLGDAYASSLGVRVKLLRLVCVICASASAASVVSFAGLLGFVGLIVPHIARYLTKGGTRAVVTTSALVGSILVTLADLLGRTAFAPTEVPVGIIMALLGAPFFLILLIGGRKKGA
jgi:iron complex transport system permease protein